MLKHRNHGFSFLELMVVLALIGLLGAFVVPNIFKTTQGAVQKEFLSEFETLIKGAVLRSILENTVHQIYIDTVHEFVEIRIYDEQSVETNEHKKFIRLQDKDYTTRVKFLKRFAIQNFFINGIDEVAVGTVMQDVMFYIMPDGSSQAIIANIADQDTVVEMQDNLFSVIINPFYARMSVYETFQTP
jgi:prepilin-type N-terminal cleavage/methylation domain-containing protein